MPQSLQHLGMSMVSPDRITKLGYAYREAKALLTAVELGVFTALSDGPLGPDALSRGIGIDQRGARDFFDALVALGLLDRDEGGCYANTPETGLYLDRSKQTYLGGELEFINAQLYGRWNFLTMALKTGRPQTERENVGPFADRYADPAALTSFARAMTAATLPVAATIATKFPWADYHTFVDIGSAQGCLPVEVSRRHEHLTGGGFDLPPMKPVFDSYIVEHGLSDRLHFHGGDFFRDALPKADVLVMGRVLHNWDMSGKMSLLRSAYDAVSPGGALIVYERMIDDERRTNATALLSSLNMLLMTAGGFDFSGADCIRWMREAGFSAMRVQPLTTDQSMVVGFK